MPPSRRWMTDVAGRQAPWGAQEWRRHGRSSVPVPANRITDRPGHAASRDDRKRFFSVWRARRGFGAPKKKPRTACLARSGRGSHQHLPVGVSPGVEGRARPTVPADVGRQLTGLGDARAASGDGIDSTAQIRRVAGDYLRSRFNELRGVL